jgi:predicted transcriptional regulator
MVPQDKTNSVIDLYKDILRAVEDLATCSYTSEAFSELLGRVQAAVSAYLLYPLGPSLTTIAQIDRLNLEGYANLDHWVAELDKRIETILLQRLAHIIQVWCSEFDRIDEDTRRDTLPLRDMTKRRGDKRMKEEKVCTAT